jgi:putative PIN family toxin of toxin-antitoxin system
MRVYFDASIVIAALLSPTGGLAQLFRFIKLGIITGITSQTVVEEVMEEDKTKRIKRSIDEIEQFIDKSELIVREAITDEELEPYQDQVDREDAHLIAGAKLTKCTHLVTLDKKHLLRSDIQEKFLPLLIVSPKEVLEEIASSW